MLDKRHCSGTSLGHPIGATGAMRMTTLLHGMKRRNAKYGLETTTGGGGLGVCAIVERRFVSSRQETCTERSEQFMSKQRKKIPSFKSEEEERAFWETHDSTVYLDWTQAQQVIMPNLKPSTKTISLRLPQHLLDSIKAAANARDVPYQSLIKVWLQEKLHER